MIKSCPKHNKPFPCGRCRIENAQKPPQAPPAPAGVAEAQKSASALRAEKWRHSQSPQFKQAEAGRRREERKKKREDRMLAGWLREYPIDNKSNEFTQKNLGKVFLSGAPSGKGLANTGYDLDKGRASGRGYSGDTDIKDDGLEQEDTFARRISFKGLQKTVIRLGSRNVRLFWLSQPVEKLLSDFVADNTILGLAEETDERNEYHERIWTSANPAICKICHAEIHAPFPEGTRSVRACETLLPHFEVEHRQDLIDYLRWFQSKAYLPKLHKCSERHEAIAARCSGPDKIYCRKCHKLLYRPSKRSDAPAEPANAA